MNKTLKPVESLVEIAETIRDRQDSVVIYKRMTQNEYLQEFACIFLNNMSDIMEKFRLTQTETRILFKLGKYLQFGNKITIKQKQLADELQLNPTHVSSAIKRLKLTEILLVIDGELYFNPQLLAKGKIDNYVIEISNKTQVEQAVKPKTLDVLTQEDVDTLLQLD